MNRHSTGASFLRADPVAGPARAWRDGARAPDPEDQVAILTIVRRNWRSILALGGVGFVLAIIYVATAPSIYTAKARVYIESRSSPVTARDTPGAATPLEIPEVESQVEYIRSEKIALAAVRRLGLSPTQDLAVPSHPLVAKVREAVGAVKLFVGHLIGLSPSHKTNGAESLEERQAGTVRENLEAARIGAAYVIEVGYSLDNPTTAAAVANAVADAYVATQLENRSQIWKVAGEWILPRLREMQQRASQASREAQTYKAEHAIIDLGKRGLVGEQQLEELNTAVATARSKTVDARATRDQIHMLLASDIADPGITEAFKDTVIIQLRKQYVDLVQRADDLKRRLGPDHAAVTTIQKDVLAAKQSLRAELERLAASLDRDYEVAKSREDSMTSAFDALISKTLVTSEARVKAKELDRAAETYDQIYTNLLSRYIDAVNQQSYPQPSAHVITSASVPERPSAPRGSLIVLLGVLVGAGLGVSGAFARHWFDRTIRAPGQLTGQGLPCLAALPELRREPGYRAALALAQNHASEALRPASVEAFKASVVRFMPQSVFVERLHSLKTHLLGNDRRGPVFAIGVTSVGGSTGKTTFASNFAQLLARSRSASSRILLIDADVRQATLSQLNQAADQHGLLDVLAGRCGTEEAVRHQLGDVRLLTCGSLLPGDPHFSDLMTPEAIAGLVQDERTHLDRIVVDLPAVDELPTLRPLLDMLDGMILVAEAGKTNIDDVVAAVHDLESAGCTVLGVVLNKTNATPAVRRGTIVDALVQRTASLKPAATPTRLARSWRRRPAADVTDSGASA
ncbi:GumC family protein [Methylobacterium pseudosasicola]|uniref:Succinoglycan biosynthesis transport protein ExoP n=1 Tax=Methylobacterium pseudosasicola TaxID=582667 RepID=A0A1I4HEV9_9HYPH|nr:GNVR domain-containing protein [Methylobacterium pseudosasicola]SFL40654.1 succinoglycan biosynthesis transport protein ExoP [Methylobacterium pseudosasicola]